MIGNEKKAYYEKGLIEKVVTLINVDTDPLVLYECIAILNSFLINFPDALEVF